MYYKWALFQNHGKQDRLNHDRLSEFGNKEMEFTFFILNC